jgi:hypothetical protein
MTPLNDILLQEIALRWVDKHNFLALKWVDYEASLQMPLFMFTFLS